MKPRYLFFLLVVWLAICSSLFSMIYAETKGKAISALISIQMIHAEQAKREIEAFFRYTVATLTKMAESEHVITMDGRGRRELDFALSLIPDAITAITRVDAEGRIVYSAPFNPEVIGRDISGQDHIQRILKTRKPVVSDVFTAVQGYRAVALHVPLFKENEFLGTVGVLIDFESIARRHLEAIRLGETGYAWMTSKEGIELYCPVPGHTGRSVFENCKHFPTIIAMANQMVKGRQGVTTYTFDQIRDKRSETITKQAVYLPIKIVDTFWTIVVASSEDEVLWTLASLRDRLILVFSLLFSGSIVFSYYGMKAWGIVREEVKRKEAELALRYERDLMQRIMETSPAGITRADAAGRIVYANRRAEAILGMETAPGRERTYNDPVWKITDFAGNPFSPDRLPFAIVKKTGKPVDNVQHAIEWPNGRQVFLSINAAPLVNVSGVFDGMVATIEDITEKYKAEQHYQTLFREMIDGFAIHEIICDDRGQPVDYRFLAVNPAFERLTGQSGESLVGKTVMEVWPNTEPYWIEKYGKVALTGEPASFENYSSAVARHFQVTAFRHAKNQFACIFVDITDQKQAEADRNRLQTQLANAVDIAHLGHWEYDVVNDRFTFNDQFYKIFHTTAGQVGGYTMTAAEYAQRFVHPDDRHLVAEAVRNAIRTTDPKYRGRLEHRMIYADGSTGHISVLFFLVQDAGGRTIKTYGVNQDISERKRIEERLQQAQKMEAIGSLAGGIAHDFNNLLFPIVGMAEMLLEDLAPESPGHGYVQEIYMAGQRASELVKQILAFSRRSEHQMIPVRLQQILREVLKLSRASIPSNIEIAHKVKDDCGMVFADPTQVHQVAMNLITNAYHAVEASGGRIALTLDETVLGVDDLPGSPLVPGRYARLSVSDTGCGIAPEIMDKIFEPYFTTKEQGKGTGLGLALVYGIVKEHKGDIKVHSERGRGTTFDIHLPLMGKAEAPLASEIEIHNTGDERVLLVDDEEAIAKLVCLMLERLGYRVTSRTGSLEALAEFKTDPKRFDLVITDMTMPQMTGDRLAREMIAIRADVPIIICTGFSERIDRESAQAMGIKGFLMKPVVRSEMARMVRKVLDDARNST